jgi:hypothetical protein
MFKKIKDWMADHKWLVFKLVFALLVVLAVLQWQSYSGRMTAQYIHRAIHHGLLESICVGHSSNISSDAKGVFISINKRKYYIEDQWASTKPKQDLYLAILSRRNGGQRGILIDSANARRFLKAQDPEGCRRFRKASDILQGRSSIRL